ncbi:MAG: ABC transporter ATP-binding protein [Candidatus Micrarchaeota archaeon]
MSKIGSIAVDVKNLAITYQNGKKSVEDCSFAVHKGETVGLLGSNGAGKSTILRTIAGLNPNFDGRILVFGNSISTNLKLLKSKMAFVPQESAFFMDFTVRENLSYMMDAYNISGSAKNERIADLLKVFFLKPFENIRAKRLSGGYKQLLNVAMSFVIEPDLVLFDEPTVGLDITARKMFADFIISLKKMRKTILITTHYLDEAQALCDKIVLLKDGKLVAYGSIGDLVLQYGGRYTIILKFKALDEKLVSLCKTFKYSALSGSNANYVYLTSDQKEIGEAIVELTEKLKEHKRMFEKIDVSEPSITEVFKEVMK